MISVFVAGGAGYIGSHMVWKLVDAGEDVIVADRLSTGFDWAVAPEAELVVADIADQETVEDAIRCCRDAATIHFAGSIIVPESVAAPLGYYSNNSVKSHAPLKRAVRCGVRHFVCSAAGYGTPQTVPVSENAPTSPQTPYGKSKLMTECILRDTAAAHDFHFAALRYFNVSGADPQMRASHSTEGATHLIKVASETATDERPYMKIYGTDYPTPAGTCGRDHIQVWDLVEAHHLALQRLRAGGASVVVSCGYGHGYTVGEVIDTVKRVTGKDFGVRVSGRRPGDAVSIITEASRAKTEFAWRPQYDLLERIVQHALEWKGRLRYPMQVPSKSNV